MKKYKKLSRQCYYDTVKEEFMWVVSLLNENGEIDHTKGYANSFDKADTLSSKVYSEISSKNKIEVRVPYFNPMFSKPTLHDEIKDIKRILFELSNKTQKEFLIRFGELQAIKLNNYGKEI